MTEKERFFVNETCTGGMFQNDNKRVCISMSVS